VSTPAATQTQRILTLLAAILGWMFDGFEMGLFPLIGQPALTDLLGPDAPPADTAKWFGAIIAVFLVGAASGGVLFGWLGDKIGRVRAMSISIFTYAIFTGLCGFATEAWHIAALRFVASLGMGGEWSLGVALVNEIWPGKSRALIAGLIGAAANVGYLLVAVLSMVMLSFIGHAESLLLGVGVSAEMTAKLLSNSAWRLLMISGAVPALLIFFIRLFVPESKKWEAERAAGFTSNWSNIDLLAILAGSLSALSIIYIWAPTATDFATWIKVAVTLVGLAICLLSFLYPVRQYLRRTVLTGRISSAQESQIVGRMILGAALAGVALLGTWGSIQWAPKWAAKLMPNVEKITHEDGTITPAVTYFAAEKTQAATAIGAIGGTILAALAAGRFGRRPTYAILCVASVLAAVYFFRGHDSFGTSFLIAAFFAGGITASFYGFFPLYFPELFPTAVRATGQGFAFNFGRIIAAVGGLQTSNLLKYFDDSMSKAGSLLACIYLIGVVIIWFGPETKGKNLPD